MGKEQAGMEEEDDEGGQSVISVVLTTYNRADRLKKAIKSVLDQTYTYFELIVVDDASTDDTQKVVKSFKDKRIVYLKRKKNFGCDTRPKNEGILKSEGKYIAFLDDDNCYRPDHLNILNLELEADDKVAMVYGDRWLVDETDRIEGQIGICSDFNPTLLMQRNYIDTSDVLVRSQDLFDVGGFDERYRKYIDWNLWLRMMKFGKRFKRVPKIITNYHLHENMKSLLVKNKGEDQTKFVPEWDAYDLEVELPYLKNTPTEPKVAVFTLTYDRLEYTKQSFKSLKDTAGYPYDHFIVDNGSKDGTYDWLKNEYDFKEIILNKENLGISKSSNQAVEMIKGGGDYDIIVKFDNDCMCITEGWLAKMVEIWKSNHIFALSPYVQGLMDNPGGSPRIGYGMIKGELIGVSRHLGGICHFVDARAYNNFRWDEDSFYHGVQDVEFSQHLMFSGYSMGYLENYFVSHGPEGTSKQKDDFPEYFDKRKKEKTTKYAKDGK